MSNDFYVYIDWRLDTNEPFYVGKGKGKRWKEMNHRNDHFKRIENNIPIAVEIVKDNLTEDEALGIECYLIHELVFEYGFSIDIKNNRGSDGDWLHLASATWGGEGTSGWTPTEEQKKKWSEERKGENNPMYGKNPRDFMTEEAKIEQSKRLSEFMKGRYCGADNPVARTVVNLNSGKIFNTLIEGAEFYNIKNPSNIGACCRNEYLSSGKLEDGTPLVWAYYEDYLNMTEEEIQKKIEIANEKGVKVINLTTMKIFDTMKEGAEFYNCSVGGICSNCKGEYKSSGKDKNNIPLVWMYYDKYLENPLTEEEIKEKIEIAIKVLDNNGENNPNYGNGDKIKGSNNPNAKAVINLTTMKIFDTIKEGAKYYGIKDKGGITQCCRGRQKSCGKLEDGTKLVWMYYKDYLALENNNEIA